MRRINGGFVVKMFVADLVAGNPREGGERVDIFWPQIDLLD